MFLGMLRLALELCCHGCHKITYNGPFKNFERFEKNATFVMPVQTTEANHQFYGYDYVHIYEVKAVKFLGPKLVYSSHAMLMVIFNTVVNSLPLFGISLAMAVTAGVTIWVLDSAWNQNQFPDEFPRGPFEGFWWAVVSMTTVGYGDRSPKSVVARLFAIIWILTGITIFSLYTASLTSSISSALISSHDNMIAKKTFAVLNSTTLGVTASLRENTPYKKYSSIDDISKAIQAGKIGGLAVDENVAEYFGHHLQENMTQPLVIYKRIIMMGSSYGLTTSSEEFVTLLKTFFTSNDDQRDAMAAEAMEEHHDHKLSEKLKMSRVEAYDFFVDRKLTQSVGVSLLIITIILTCVGIVIKRMKAEKGCRGLCLTKSNANVVSVTVQPRGESPSMKSSLEEELTLMLAENHNMLKEKMLTRLRNEYTRVDGLDNGGLDGSA